jgi:multidrug efflux pump subunit AcrB
MTDQPDGDRPKTPLLTRVVDVFLRGDTTILLILVSLVLGAAALYLTPREEDPQIVVPMADVLIQAPGASAQEVERQVASRLEKLLYQIDGVEHIYSRSHPGQCVVTVRFFVGEDREDSLVKLYNKINSNIDQVPPIVREWVVKPVDIDDVPIVILTLWSEQPRRHDDHALRRIAEELQLDLKAIRNTNRVRVFAGRPRRIRIRLDPARLAAHRTAPGHITRALRAANVRHQTQGFPQQNEQFLVRTGDHLQNLDDLRELVLQVVDGRLVYLHDVATVLDGPAEVATYSWIGFGPADGAESEPEHHGLYPAVHLGVAKRKGSNAVSVADAVEQRMDRLASSRLPEGVHYRVTRNYGETANAKVNELVEALLVAVLTVIGLIGFTLGWRSAVVITLAVPVTYSLTLFVNYVAGYTINRVTLFALILSLGLLVDDPITDVENIARYFSRRVLPPRESVLQAVQEVRPALLLSTLAIITSFLPLAFITGMMGPYMAPMALNVPLTVSMSTLVAFLITPWLALSLMRGLFRGKPGGGETDDSEHDLSGHPAYRFYRWWLAPLLDRPLASGSFLAAVFLLFCAALILPLFRAVPVKMLPFDNKNEFQIVIDMPEGATLEETDSVARRLGAFLKRVPEVRDFEIYSGLASPMDFNGLVRHYYLRRGPHVADIRVNLADKEHRSHQSHELLLRIRDQITELARPLGAAIRLVEVPPGPPVLATITAEVYGPDDASYQDLIAAAEHVRRRLRQEPGVVEIDWSATDRQRVWEFATDKQKAALSGVTPEQIGRVVQTAMDGRTVGVLHAPREVDPLRIRLQVPLEERAAIHQLQDLYLLGDQGQLVQLGSLGDFQQVWDDQPIMHKDLRRVVFVYANVAGRPPGDAIVDMEADRVESAAHVASDPAPRAPEERTWFSPGGGVPWSLPAGFAVRWAGEGEWQITLDVFRDLGLAFAAALLGIFVILMFQTGSRILPLIIMLAIPLTLIGIMPGFWLLNLLTNRQIGGYASPVYFTATAMIGMIALAGIVVRNSVVLIDFIQYARKAGHDLREAILRSVAIRTRPILLTAATTLLGNWVITLDPIFSGLAWAIIFGILASTIFTLGVIPTVYGLVYGRLER